MTVSSQIVENRYLKPGQSGFAGHIIFYPGCWWLFDPERDKESSEICDPVSKNCKYEGPLPEVPYIFWQGNPIAFVKENYAMTFQIF